MLTADSALLGDLGNVIASDPEVRQARNTVEAARVRLVASVSSQEDGIDLAEAQAMLDAINEASAYAADAEDRVLRHYGLLTEVEADKRAAKRRPASAAALPQQRTEPDPGVRTSAGSAGVVPAPRTWLIAVALAAVLTFALTAVIGTELARRLPVTLPQPRW